MLMPRGDTARDQGLVALQIDETDVGPIPDQNIAVAALQGGARDDAMSTRAARLVDPVGDRMQPGPTVLVGEWNAAVHLVDVRSWMKPIRVLEFPSETGSKKRSDS